MCLFLLHLTTFSFLDSKIESASELKKTDALSTMQTLAAGKTTASASAPTKAISKASSSKKPSKPSSSLVQKSNIKEFMKGASAAQQTQIQMICRVFEIMDADCDGILSFADVKAYFKAIGRLADDTSVRKWIRNRDIDQTGTVSLAEFISSFATQFDPTKPSEPKENGKSASSESSTVVVSPLTTAFGLLKLGNTTYEVSTALQAAEEYIRRILDSPSTEVFWRIPVSDPAFQQTIGRLFGGMKLMRALGFSEEANGSVLAIRNSSGVKWVTLPESVRKQLGQAIEELSLLKQSLAEATISHVAGGKIIIYYCTIITNANVFSFSL